MVFGLYSTNPRMRRAYADAMLVKATGTGAPEDYEAARIAVESAGDPAKAKQIRLRARLASVALLDVDTHAIVQVARETLDPELTPPSIEGGERLQHVLQKRGSPDLRGVSDGAISFRGYWQRVGDGHVEGPARLVVADQTEGRSFIVPLIDHETVDILAVRQLPDDTRSEAAALARRITMPLFP